MIVASLHFPIIFVLIYVFLNTSSASKYSNYEPCEDWTRCRLVKCAKPEYCSKAEPYLIWDECGCCQRCSATPKIGPCGECGKDVKCKESEPICTKENQIVTIDNCGCCKVCKDVLSEGERCQTKGGYAVCDAGLKCLKPKYCSCSKYKICRAESDDEEE